MIIGTLAEIADSVVSGNQVGFVKTDQDNAFFGKDDLESALNLLNSFKLQHGDRIVVIASPSIKCVAMMLAAWSAGIVVVPLKGELLDVGIRVVADDCHATIIVDPDSNECVVVNESNRSVGSFRFCNFRRVSGVDLAMIIYTSGSSGKPKGIMLTHANIIVAVQAISSALGLHASDRILCVSPLSFDYGLYQVLFAFHTGCTTVLFSRTFNPMACIETLKKLEITILPIVPSIGTAVARTAKALKSQIPALRLITNTGGHLPQATIEMLREVFPLANVCPMYGLSESKRALIFNPAQARSRIGSVGMPMPGLAAAVFSRNTVDGVTFFEECAPGEVGELFVRGASVMQGYTSDMGGGAEIIPGAYRDDNWLATGDLFATDEDGYFYYRGRVKEMIKQDGFCLYPREIEEVAERHPDVELAVVFGATDKWENELACIAIQRSDGANDSAAEKLFRTWLEGKLSSEYQPRLICMIESMPLSPNGKPDRAALRAKISNAPESSAV